MYNVYWARSIGFPSVQKYEIVIVWHRQGFNGDCNGRARCITYNMIYFPREERTFYEHVSWGDTRPEDGEIL